MRTNNSFRRRLQPGFGTRTLFAILIAGTLQPTFAATTHGPVFKSPEDAIEALYNAATADDETAISRLIGSLAASDDVAQYEADNELFVREYAQMHRMLKERDGTTVLYIGAENWPFPVPLV